MRTGVLLQNLLRPLDTLLAQRNVRDIACNEPGVLWVERSGTRGMVRQEVPELTAEHIVQFARQVAVYTDQQVSEEHPLLSGSLPGGERIQFVLPPVSIAGAFCIRRQSVRGLRHTDYDRMGAYRPTLRTRSAESKGLDPMGLRIAAHSETLMKAFETASFPDFFEEAVTTQRSILISGKPGSGKTEYLRMLALEHIPASERIIVLEDTRELELPHPNRLELLVSKGDQGEARVDMAALLETALRMRPDRILLGELRGAEAFTYLRALNFGGRGSLATLHADSAERAIEQLVLMVGQAGTTLEPNYVRAYVRPLIDVIVHMDRDASGAHYLKEVQLA